MIYQNNARRTNRRLRKLFPWKSLRITTFSDQYT